MSAIIETLTSYVPGLIRQRITADLTPPHAPSFAVLQGVVLFADISGFTAITKQLALSRASGVKQVSQILNINFRTVINLALDHNGDVIKFASDALLVIWPDTSPKAAALNVARCALAAQYSLAGYKVTAESELSTPMGLGAAPSA